MKRLTVFIALALIASGCVEFVLTPTEDGWRGRAWLSLPTGQPTATAPIPTATIPPTNTPRPTLTPSPTPTTTPTATPTRQPEDDATPTQEGPLPPCEGAVVTNVLNVRESHDVRATKRGTLSKDERINPVRLWAATRPTNYPLWVYFEGTSKQPALKGWAAVTYRADNTNTLAEIWIQLAPSCSLPTDIEAEPTKEAKAPALLFHAVPSANGGEMAQAFDILARAGIRFGVKGVNTPDLVNLATSKGGVAVFRSVHPGDCPDVTNPDPKREAYLWVLAYGPYVQQNTRPTFVEWSNECNYGDPRWWNVFGVELLRLVRDWPSRPILPTFGPGWPERWHVAPMRDLWLALLAADGCVGIHAYGVTRGVRLVDSGAWLGYRHRLFHQWLIDVDPRLAALDMCITEAAKGPGDEPPDVRDFVDYWYSIRNDTYIDHVALWTAGHTTAWPRANLNGWMIEIANLATTYR